MKNKNLQSIIKGISALLLFLSTVLVYSSESEKTKKFNLKKDLLLVHFDCKTDVDDIHTIAGLVTLLNDSKYKKINYHAVAGTYGNQKGLYVPPNSIMPVAFGDNWTDAHENVQPAIAKVKALVLKTLSKKGNIWIAEAGQSDFTAELIKAIQAELPDLKVSERINVVQHSEWNEKHTTPESLTFVKNTANYIKIADGNKVGNGTPGFQDATFTDWKSKIGNPKLVDIWQTAVDLANKYDGKEGRYANKAITVGGLDFSDLSEVCWILGLQDIKDTAEFFSTYAQ